jgi:hypothetical protein
VAGFSQGALPIRPRIVALNDERKGASEIASQIWTRDRTALVLHWFQGELRGGQASGIFSGGCTRCSRFSNVFAQVSRVRSGTRAARARSCTSRGHWPSLLPVVWSRPTSLVWRVRR